MKLTDEVRALLTDASDLPWEPYFTVHGDPYVVSANAANKVMHAIATVSTDPDDYGKANCKLLAAAPKLAQLAETLEALLTEARCCEGLQEWDWDLCERIDAALAPQNADPQGSKNGSGGAS